MKPLVIAVDGPAASGKGTVASGLAEHYGVPYLDTGLIYRLVGLIALRRGVDLDDGGALHAMLGAWEGSLADPEIRLRKAGEAASRVAVHPQVRSYLLDWQRDFAADPKGAVLDGRDIGTVIAPDATAKLYVTATPEVRAERRWKQMKAQGEAASLEDVLEDIRRRDARDGGRETAPMTPAPDAVLLDTSEMTIEQAADAARRIVEAARARRDDPR